MGILLKSLVFQTYTIANESQHIFIYGVPKIKLRAELKNLCLKYGQILALHVVTDHKTEIFTECYHVHYAKIQSARIAKRQLDNRSFYGGILHVCYAPERESVEDTKAKLLQRSKDVLSRLYGTLDKNCENIGYRKRKYDECDLEVPKNKIEKKMQSNEVVSTVYGPQLPVNYHQEDDVYGLQLCIEKEAYSSSSVNNIKSSIVEKKIIFRNQ